MIHFLSSLIHPDAVMMLAVWVFFLFNIVWGGVGAAYTEARAGTNRYSFIPFIFYLIVTVVAFIAWCFLVFA